MKTTRDQFELFKKECQKWINFFGLHGWAAYYRHILLEPDVGAMCEPNMNQRLVCFSLNLEPDTDSIDIKKMAFHEVDELRFTRIEELAKIRYISEGELREEVHNLIRQDENLFYHGSKRR